MSDTARTAVGVVACGALALHVAGDRRRGMAGRSTSTRCRRRCTTGRSGSLPLSGGSWRGCGERYDRLAVAFADCGTGGRSMR